jgi:hypothetical protein
MITMAVKLIHRFSREGVEEDFFRLTRLRSGLGVNGWISCP